MDGESVNARGFVSLSTQPLNFPAAGNPEAGGLTPADQCGLGPQPDVSRVGQAAGVLAVEHQA